VSKIVGEIEHVVGTHGSAVGIGKADIFSPGPQEFSVPIIDDDGMRAARENVDIIFTVDADGGGVAVRVAGWQLAPVLNHLISVISLSKNDWRGCSARGLGLSHECHRIERSGRYRG